MQKLSLQIKLSIGLCLIVLFSLSFFAILSQSESTKILQEQTDTLGNNIALRVANSVRELVLANDLLSLNVVLDQNTRSDNLARISVFDIDGQLLASSSAVNSSLSVSSPQSSFDKQYQAQIIISDAIAGSVLLHLDTSALQNSTHKVKVYFWIILFLGITLSILLATFIATYITTPILNIVGALQSPADYTLDKETEREDEISLLQNTAASFLKRYQQETDKQKSLSAVIDSGSNDPHNKPLKIMASILIIKVVNINTAIELLHPSTLSKLLNEYVFYLKQAAKLYGGNVHRFSGDSVMVSFDARQANEKYGLNAVCCAQLFQILMDKIAQQHREKCSQALEFRLAVHSGETFITRTNNNLHEEAQSEILVGKVIETSYFLSKQSKPGQLIISETTYEQAGGGASLASEGSIEITMPSDNMSFMAYILNNDAAKQSELMAKQYQHILSSSA